MTILFSFFTKKCFVIFLEKKSVLFSKKGCHIYLFCNTKNHQTAVFKRPV
jgi:hypothetical protein